MNIITLTEEFNFVCQMYELLKETRWVSGISTSRKFRVYRTMNLLLYTQKLTVLVYALG
jgi:hypothetical protein